MVLFGRFLWLAARSPWPNTPLSTSGRSIVDASGAHVRYAGVNWPGAAETMLPEGLQYRSVGDIVSAIKGLGINAVRLTYATEMVDQIVDRGKDVPIRDAFTAALGEENGTAVYKRVVANNPSFGPTTTRLEIFDAVADECARQQIYVHLDNHVSRSGWCCNPLDGNAWWGDEYFSTANWTRGLAYMAKHGKSWPALTSMSLRNELRQPLSDIDLYRDAYNWETWYANVRQGARAISDANPDVLIFLSGLDSDTDLGPVVRGDALEPSTRRFDRNDFGRAGSDHRLVLELHNYEFTYAANCSTLRDKLLAGGFDPPSKNEFPVVMTEFGFEQNATAWNQTYGACVTEFLRGHGAGWMLWVLAGSYYVREGGQDRDESWGLLTHDWKGWRSPEFVGGGLRRLVEGGNNSRPEDGDSNSSGSLTAHAAACVAVLVGWATFCLYLM